MASDSLTDTLANILGVCTTISLGTAPETDQNNPTEYRLNLDLGKVEFFNTLRGQWERSMHNEAIYKIFRGQRGRTMSGQGQFVYDALAAKHLLGQVRS